MKTIGFEFDKYSKYKIFVDKTNKKIKISRNVEVATAVRKHFDEKQIVDEIFLEKISISVRHNR